MPAPRRPPASSRRSPCRRACQFVSASSEPGTAPVGAGRRPHGRPGDDRVRGLGHRHDRHRSVRVGRGRHDRASPRRSPATQYDPEPAEQSGIPEPGGRPVGEHRPDRWPPRRRSSRAARSSRSRPRSATWARRRRRASSSTFPPVSGLAFVSSSPSQGTPALVSGQFFARLGDAGARRHGDRHRRRSSRRPPATYTMTASVSETEYNLDLPAASASRLGPGRGIARAWSSSARRRTR